MQDDLLECAALAVDSFFAGQDRAKRSIRFDMENLRVAVNAEKKRRAQSETTTLTRADRDHA